MKGPKRTKLRKSLVKRLKRNAQHKRVHRLVCQTARLSVPTALTATLSAFPMTQHPAVSACVQLLDEGFSLPFVARYRAATLPGKFEASDVVQVGKVWTEKVQVFKQKQRILRRAKHGLSPEMCKSLRSVDATMSEVTWSDRKTEEDIDEEDIEMAKLAIGNFLFLVCVCESAENDRYRFYRERLRDVRSHEFFALRRLRGRASEFRVDLEDLVIGLPELQENWDKIVRRVKRLVWQETRERAQEELLENFKKNLKQKLQLAPAIRVEGQRRVVAIDPGMRHGNKVALVCKNSEDVGEAVVQQATVLRDVKLDIIPFIERTQPDCIVVGNGLNGKEVFNLLIRNLTSSNILVGMIDEAGSSQYSVSAIAQAELPEFPIILRSAITLARRVLDPLGEFVKVDPECLSVGLYQKDLRKDRLDAVLKEAVQEVVLDAGADLNSVNEHVLSKIPGVSASLAHNIVHYRSIYPFTCRSELLNVMDMDHCAFTNLAGFVRVFHGSNPLDATFLHPEQYASFAAPHLLQPETASPQICDLRLLSEWRDVEIAKGLIGLGTSETFVEGVVRNVVEFGVFVDIGGDRDGLLHRSQFSGKSDFRVGETISVRVLGERGEGKLALSMREADPLNYIDK